jgi:hypothetical protein
MASCAGLWHGLRQTSPINFQVRPGLIRIIAEAVFVVAAHISDVGRSGELKCDSEHCQAVFCAMKMALATRSANNPPGGLLRDLDRKLPRRDEADHSAPDAHKFRDIVQSRGIA